MYDTINLLLDPPSHTYAGGVITAAAHLLRAEVGELLPGDLVGERGGRGGEPLAHKLQDLLMAARHTATQLRQPTCTPTTTPEQRQLAPSSRVMPVLTRCAMYVGD